MKSIVILISGAGSNMAAIVRACERERWAERLNARVAAVISNRPGAKGLDFAREQGIAAAVVDHKAFDGREAFDTALAAEICRARGVAVIAGDVHAALEHDDVLAAAFARLLLWTDPKSLPALNDADGAWQLYLRTWRPGAYPRGTAEQKAALRKKWGAYYAQAMQEASKCSA